MSKAARAAWNMIKGDGCSCAPDMTFTPCCTSYDRGHYTTHTHTQARSITRTQLRCFACCCKIPRFDPGIPGWFSWLYWVAAPRRLDAMAESPKTLIRASPGKNHGRDLVLCSMKREQQERAKHPMAPVPPPPAQAGAAAAGFARLQQPCRPDPRSGGGQRRHGLWSRQ